MLHEIYSSFRKSNTSCFVKEKKSNLKLNFGKNILYECCSPSTINFKDD